jgi:hypothetical protein
MNGDLKVNGKIKDNGLATILIRENTSASKLQPVYMSSIESSIKRFCKTVKKHHFRANQGKQPPFLSQAKATLQE